MPLPRGLPLTNGLLQRLVGDLLGRHSLGEKGQKCTERSGRWRGREEAAAGTDPPTEGEQ